MWRSRSAALVSACTALAVSLSVAPATQASPLSTVVDPGGDLAHEYTDVRDTTLVRPTRAQLDAVSEIVSAAPQGARVTYDDRFGTPRTIRPNAGGALTAPSSGTAVALARAWLADNRAALGLSTADVASLENTRDHVLGTGTHIVGFRQTFGGVQAVHGGSMTVAVRPNGAIESYAGQTVRSAELTGDWGLSAGRALETVAGDLAGATGFAARATGSKAGYTAFAKGGFAAGSYVKKTVFVTADGARPAYQVLFVEKLDEAYDVLLDPARRRPYELTVFPDAESARHITSAVAERDAKFLTGDRTPAGVYRLKDGTGLDHCIARGLAFAEHADLLWWETSHPDLNDARVFADAVHKQYPGKLLAYNCSPSFNWKAKLDDGVIRVGDEVRLEA